MERRDGRSGLERRDGARCAAAEAAKGRGSQGPRQQRSIPPLITHGNGDCWVVVCPARRSSRVDLDHKDRGVRG